MKEPSGLLRNSIGITGISNFSIFVILLLLSVPVFVSSSLPDHAADPVVHESFTLVKTGSSQTGAEAFRDFHGKIIVEPDSEETGTTGYIKNFAERKISEICWNLGLQQPPFIVVQLAHTEASFMSRTGGRVPEWGAGVAFPREGRVVLNLEKTGRDGNRISMVLTHELTHIVFGWNTRNNPGRVPRWFDEGLAMYEAGQWRLSDSFILAKAALSGRIIPLWKLEQGFPFDEGEAGLAYTEGYTAVSFLVAKGSAAALSGICGKLASGEAFSVAMEEELGISLSEFDELWFEYVKKHYRWVYLLNDTSIFWGLTAVMVLLGYVLVRLRRRKKLEKMD